MVRFKDKTPNSMKPVSWYELLTAPRPHLLANTPTHYKPSSTQHQAGFPAAFVAEEQQPSRTQRRTEGRRIKAPPPGSRWKSAWEETRPHDFPVCFNHPTTPRLTQEKHTVHLCSNLRETIFHFNNAGKKKKLIRQLCCVPSRKGSRDSQVLSTQHLPHKICLSNKPGKTGIIKAQSKRCRNLTVSEMKDAFFKWRLAYPDLLSLVYLGHHALLSHKKHQQFLISPKATYAAALDEMSPCTASSDSLQSKVEKEQYVGTRQCLYCHRQTTQMGISTLNSGQSPAHTQVWARLQQPRNRSPLSCKALYVLLGKTLHRQTWDYSSPCSTWLSFQQKSGKLNSLLPTYAPFYFCTQRMKTSLNNPSPLGISFSIENSDKTLALF